MSGRGKHKNHRTPPKPFGKGLHDNAVETFIDAYWREHFRSPSIRDIARGCQIGSTSLVSHTLHRMARDGEIVYVDTIARGIVPLWVRDAIQNADANSI